MIIKRSLVLRKHALFIAITYSLGLAIMSLINLGELPKLPMDSGDKIVHFFAYFIMSLLWFNVFSLKEKLKRRLAILNAGILSLVFGIIIELLQSTLTNARMADGYDLLANTLGILAAVLVILIYTTNDVKNS